MMKFKVLDTKLVDGKIWALCKGNLFQYLKNLKTDFFDFSVQRKIVNNVYLDNIYSSVEKGEPFPPVTLTYSGKIPIDSVGKEVEVDEKKIEILDGLQRTYRLWVALYFNDLIIESQACDLRTLADAARRTAEGRAVLENKFVTPKLIKYFLASKNEKKCIECLIDSYSKFDVYFNIWTGLDDKDIIRRMLVLNAGQKSVSSTHQFELLFLHFFEDKKLGFDPEIKLIREKDHEYRNVMQGKRGIGEYLMSSVVIALQSFINGKQLRISPANLINLDDNKLLNDQNLQKYFNADTLSKFVNSLFKFGKVLSDKSNEYVKWYGKDTVLSGIFGALGAHMIDSKGYADVEALDELFSRFNANDDPFKLKDYYDAYENELVSTKVNVGNAVRKAIFNYTREFLSSGSSDWYKYFSQYSDDDKE